MGLDQVGAAQISPTKSASLVLGKTGAISANRAAAKKLAGGLTKIVLDIGARLGSRIFRLRRFTCHLGSHHQSAVASAPMTPAPATNHQGMFCFQSSYRRAASASREVAAAA
jgi:hypothetical protein